MANNNNSITQTNPIYNTWLPVWNKCRDTYLGQEQVKSKGEMYLPKGLGQNDDDYQIYKKRAVFYNTTKRTVTGLNGSMFRNEVKYELPSDFEFFANNVSFGGKSITDFASEIGVEQLITSRSGIMVDYPEKANDELSEEEREQLGLQPYLSLYTAEQIINWQFHYVNNSVELKLVVLVERVEDDTDDMFETRYINQYRALYLDEKGIYRQQIYKQDQVGKSESDIITPLLNGEPMTKIPFWINTPRGLEPRIIDNPVIKDLADMNIAHYVNSADREQELYWAGVKMFVFPAWDVSKGSIPIGKPLAVPEECKPMVLQAQAGSDIQNEMTQKEQRMAVLGANIISQRGRYTDSATTAEINQSSEQSVLSAISDSISRVLEDAIKFAYMWYKGSLDTDVEGIRIEVNKDFNNFKMPAQDMIALMQMWQNGAISKQTMFQNLKQGERIDNEKTFEEEEQEIEENPPEGDVFDTTQEITSD
tara:strand:+ start:6529 stop:7962 length:1434 start_codon:yes stop_codon:yes gene_type:complete